jgi:uncharacterized protein (TIGR02679 family)
MMPNLETDAVFDRNRLQRLLGAPALKRLLDRLQRRFEQGGETGAAVQLTGVSEEERRAVETLLGRPAGRGVSLSIPLKDLEGVLRRSGAAPDLRSAVAALRGPLRDLRGEKEEATAAWRTVFRGAAEEAKALGLEDWLERLRQSGLLKRLAGGNAGRGAELLRKTLSIMSRLPVRGFSLSRLAALTLGDAHGLDPGRPVATLVQRGIVARQDLAEDQTPEGVREIWAAAGVLVGGALSSTVLALNLPVLAEGTTGRALALFATSAEPAWLTLRQLLREPPVFSCTGMTVFICENPSVVFEAAEELGATCPPLVCGNGQRNAAVTTLLRQLAAAGAMLVYHGDFDWAGVTIANGLMELLPVKPWRFDNKTYLEAVGRSGKTLNGMPVAARWDPALAAAMSAAGKSVEEEQLLDQLLADLGKEAPQSFAAEKNELPEGKR